MKLRIIISSFLLTILITLKSTNSATLKQVSCERVGLLYDYGPRTCFFEVAVINSQGFTIASEEDSLMRNLEFYFNTEIRYLPIKTHKKYPNLTIINANYCSIKTIEYENFEKLDKLERLWLAGNHIQEITTETFADLTSLEYLFLNDNNIKYLNGKVFNSLNMLKEVWLRKNDCIDENFEGQTEIADMTQTVTKTCGFQWLDGI